MSTSLTYNVQVATGSTTTILADVSRGVEGVTQRVGGMSSAFARIGAGAFIFNNIAQSVGAVSNAINQTIEPGAKLDDALRDLEAITGATDTQLKEIKKSARESALAFGVDATGGVESYKTILSQLSPELAKTPAALSGMGNDIAILSKQLEGSTTAAAGLLTTAMNQYGVSLDDPMEATRTMGVMMNIMSAAAQAGSAELPQIKSALEQAGLMAKTANVSFAETNAAIQVLDKAGKKGAEGGVAIRNILAEMALGAKQPKQVADGFKAMGIDLDKVSDQSLSFSQRLQILKPALQNQGLLTQYVGKENVAAAIALIQGTSVMDGYTKSIVGTNSAVEMAGIKMESYKEKLNRYWAYIKNIGISVFDAFRPALPAFQIFAAGVQYMAQFGAAINAVSIISNTQFGIAMGKATTSTWTFIRAQGVSMLGLLRTGAAYIYTGAVGMASYISSIITATAAQVGLNVAMSVNPIGLIVVGVAAAVGAVVLLVKHWDTIKVKIVEFGLWIWNHHPFKWLIDVVDKIFPGFKQKMGELWDWVVVKFEKLVGWIKEAFGWIKKLFSSDSTDAATGNAATELAAITSSPIAGIEVPNAGQKNAAITNVGNEPKEAKTTAQNITSGGSKPTNIYVTVGKFQDKIEIHANTFREGVDDMRRMVQEEFLAMLNSANSLSTQ